MASKEDKQILVKLARRGKLDGDDGFKFKLAELNKSGIVGPGHDYGLDWSDKPFFRPALWQASSNNHEAIVKLLLEKSATLDFADYQGRTPLHEAAYYGYQGLAELFLEKGHPVDPLDNFGHSPLFRAVEAGRDSIVELLVERKAELNRLDSDGVTPQHVAAFQGMPDMSRWLLYKGAWKNRFTIQEQPPPEVGRSSNRLANDPKQQAPSATLLTEMPPGGEEAKSDLQPQEPAEEPP